MRQAKLAYVDIAPKPPRSVLRQQMRHGTAGRSKAADPLAKLSSHGGQKVIRPPPAPGAEPLHVGLNRQKKGTVAFHFIAQLAVIYTLNFVNRSF